MQTLRSCLNLIKAAGSLTSQLPSLVLLEKPFHVGQFCLYPVIVRPMLLQQLSEVSAVLKLCLGTFHPLEEGIVLLAGPGQQVSPGLQRRPPVLLKQVIILPLQFEFHLSFLMNRWEIKVESAVLQELSPFLRLELVVSCDNERRMLSLKRPYILVVCPFVCACPSWLVSATLLLIQILVESIPEIPFENRILSICF